MNEFVDMHVHSKFSIDGMSTMEDYCLIAGKTGTRVICFTEHVDFNSAEKNLSIVKDNRKQNFVVDDYFREINRLRKKYGSLTLLSGIEFSEPSLFPEEFALYSSYPFDCITAGIHHCYNSVFPGAGNLSVSKAIYEYYQIMQKTVELGGFQVLAHLDFPKLFFDKWVIDDDVLDMILSTMIDKNILLEVNTSSLNDSCDEPMPSYSVINRYALLLDEPSNDLDIDTLIFLESFIRDSAIPIIFISHDEMLISSCANVIIHIEQLIRKTKCSITVSRLTYEDYLKFRNLQFDRQNQIAHKERSEYKKKRERLLQLYEKARHNTGWKNPDGIASSDGHAKKSMQAIVSKGKRFEREKDNFTEIPDRETGIITKFDSNIFVPSQKRIIDIELPELKIDGKVLSTNIVLSVIGNQHVCIIGKNGAGKSTLLKTIWHELKGRTDIVVGYMPQDYRDVLDYDSTPVDYLQTTYDKETYTKALTFMGTMKFTRDEMHHKIGELSGGQRAKIIYLGMVLQNANVLVLDEPTRNFSPLSAPVIRTALSEFNGTIISISHDRMYLDEVADVIYELSDNGLNTVL